MIGFNLFGGFGKKTPARVDDSGAVHTVLHDNPPNDVDYEQGQSFSELLSLNGAGQVTDMSVDGSSSFVDFMIKAREDVDIYVYTLNIFLSDTGARLDRFGAIISTSHTGMDFIEKTRNGGEVSLQSGIKTSLDLIRLAGGQPAFGSGQDAFKADISGGGDDAYFPQFSYENQMGFRYGKKLTKGTQEAIIFRINDNYTALDAFNIYARGRTI